MPIYLGSTGTASIVADLVDRVYRDYLHPGDDQPVTLTLSTGVDETETSWTYDATVLAPDEEELVAPGVLVEAGIEQVRIRSANYDTDTVVVTRGVNGTIPEVHVEGSELIVAPNFPRATVVEAVKDAIVGLAPELWHRATANVTTDSNFIEVPAVALAPESFLFASGGRYVGGYVEFIDPYPPSSTGKAIIARAPSGRDAYFSYRSAFQRPEHEQVDLADLGVRPEWHRIVIVAAAAQVIAGRPLDSLTAEYITEQLEREALPDQSPERIRNGLLTLYNIWLAEAHEALRKEQPASVVMT